MSLVVKCCHCGEEFTQELLRDHHERRCTTGLRECLECGANYEASDSAQHHRICRSIPHSGITRPGLTELQQGVMDYVYAFGAGVLCGIVVGIVLAVIGGVGLAAWWKG